VPPPLVVALAWPWNTPLAILLNVSSGVSAPTDEPNVPAYTMEQFETLEKK